MKVASEIKSIFFFFDTLAITKEKDDSVNEIFSHSKSQLIFDYEVSHKYE